MKNDSAPLEPAEMAEAAKHANELLDEALDLTFPASDPVSAQVFSFQPSEDDGRLPQFTV